MTATSHTDKSFRRTRTALLLLLALLFVSGAGGLCLRAQTGRVTADPNPAASDSDMGRTQIDWDTGDGSAGQVYVSVDGGPEVLFGGGASGSEAAPWIAPGRKYEFRLYRGTERSELLGSVEVRHAYERRKYGWISSGSVGLLVVLAALLLASHFLSGGLRRRLAESPAARRLREKIRSLDASYGSALYAFTLTRLVVLVVFLLTTNLVLTEPEIPGHPQEASIKVGSRRSLDRVGQVALINDAGWYVTIARDGYERRPFDTARQANWAFFPLYPLVWRYASRLTGELPFTGMALSNIFFLAALVLLHRLVRQFGHDAGVADRAVFYVAAFPSSYFFSLPWTESLFLCLSVGAFYAARRGSWWLAGAAGALSTATRVSGVYLFPVLLVLYLQQHGRRVRASVLSLLLIPAGALAFMAHLYSITGNPLAFRDILATWPRRSGFFLDPLVAYLLNPSEVGAPWNLKLLNFAVGVVALGCAFVLLKRREWALGLYALLSALTPLSTATLISLTRYTAVVFPVHMVLAAAGRSPRVDQTIRALFVAALALMSALFAANITLGGA